MSVRTHAPDCAKTQHLLAREENLPGWETYASECTCGATYEPGVERQLRQARGEAELLRDNWASRHVFRWER